MTVTEKDCLPVHENVVTKTAGVMHTRLVYAVFLSSELERGEDFVCHLSR